MGDGVAWDGHQLQAHEKDLRPSSEGHQELGVTDVGSHVGPQIVSEVGANQSNI